jgi:subtilisin family serine protease
MKNIKSMAWWKKLGWVAALTFLAATLLVFSRPVPAGAMVEDEKTNGAQKEDHLPGEVLVKFKNIIAPSERGQFHAENEVDVLSRIPGIGVDRIKSRKGESTEALLNRYRKNPFVEYAEPNGLFHVTLTPDDPRFLELYGLHNTGQSGGTIDADIDAPEAWDLQTGNSDIIVADIDTGVDFNHPDLAANIWTHPGEIPDNGIDDDGNGFIDDVRGWNFVGNNNNPLDDHGHGTHTSGTIAAVGNNGVGVVGVSWRAKIMPVKFLSASGSGTFEAAASAIIYSANMGARLSNNSWGCGPSPGCFSQTVEDAIAFANSKGMLFVVAAGNSNNNNDVTITYPCTSNQPNVVCVAATDRNDQKASFSNYGATTVDLGAPGVSTLSTVPMESCLLCDPSGYRLLSGTSMATPHVTGAAALVLTQSPTWTAVQLKSAILTSVDPIPALAGRTVTGGRLNVDRAIRFQPGPQPDLMMTAVSGPTSGQTGDTIIISDTVTNQGAGQASPFSVGLYLSTDATVTTADTRVGTRSVNGLEVGASSSGSTSVTLPIGLTPGTYFIGAIADFNDQILEENESNNALTGHTIDITAGPTGPDLVMTAVSGPASGEKGGTITLANTVCNKGPGSAGFFYVGLYFSTDATIVTTDPRLGERFVSGLAPGDCSNANTTVTLSGLTPGTYYIGAIADSFSQVQEDNETNNSLAGDTITVIIGEDLVMTAVSGPASGQRGGAITLSDTVNNQGVGQAGAFYVGLYLSTDATITAADTRLGERFVNGLAAGASSSGSTSVTLPNSLTPGTYYLGTIADFINQIPEDDEANNGLTGDTINITP